MWKWCAFAVATVAVVAFGWMVNDARLEVKETTAEVRRSLPQILKNTERTSETLLAVSEDVRQLRELAGITDKPRDRTLAPYADSMLDFVAASEAQIGLMPKLFGSKLKEVVPADEWVVGARKEAIWLAFRARSRREMLYKLTVNIYGSDWYIQFGDDEPIKLRDWLLAEHDLSQPLAEETPPTDPPSSEQ